MQSKISHWWRELHWKVALRMGCLVGALFLLPHRPAWSAFTLGVDVTTVGAVCNGVANDSAAFLAADAATNTAILVPVVITAGVITPCVIGANTTLAHPVYFASGASVSVTATFTLTLSTSPILESIGRIFAGAGTVLIHALKNEFIYTEWWGALADGSFDSTAAFNAAVKAIVDTNGGNIRFLSGTYTLSCGSADAVTVRGTTGATFDFPVGFKGQGMNLTILSPRTNCPGYALLTINQKSQVATLAILRSSCQIRSLQRQSGSSGESISSRLACHASKIYSSIGWVTRSTVRIAWR